MLEVSSGLADRGHHVDVAALLSVDEYSDGRYQSVRRRFLIEPADYNWPACVPRLARQLSRLVDKAGYDVVAIHTPTAAIVAAWAGLGAPSLWMLHGYGDLTRPAGLRATVRRWAERAAFRMLGRCAAVVDDAMQDAAARHLGCTPSMIHVIRNGVNLAAFPFLTRSTSDHPVIAMVGTLSPNKRIDHALRAFALIRRRIPGARLTVIGEGSERPRLLRMIAEFGLADSATLPGRQEDVSTHLASAHLFWQTSNSEGLPISIVEAMATGLPVVGTDVRGTRSVVEDKTTGFLVELEDVQALADRSADLLLDPALYQRFAQAAHARAAAEFAAPRMIDDYERTLRSLAKAA